MKISLINMNKNNLDPQIMEKASKINGSNQL